MVGELSFHTILEALVEVEAVVGVEAVGEVVLI